MEQRRATGESTLVLNKASISGAWCPELDPLGRNEFLRQAAGIAAAQATRGHRAAVLNMTGCAVYRAGAWHPESQVARSRSEDPLLSCPLGPRPSDASGQACLYSSPSLTSPSHVFPTLEVKSSTPPAPTPTSHPPVLDWPFLDMGHFLRHVLAFNLQF